MNQSKIYGKAFYAFYLNCDSPVSVGYGDSINTDHDVVIDDEGTPYIPASSIAGSFFGNQKNAAKLYKILNGDVSEANPNESPLFVSDGIFEPNTKITKRDGNKLSYIEKQALGTAKFDYEGVEKNSKFTFFIEYKFKDLNTSFKDIENDILDIVGKINEGIYRLGFKQNRGFGKLSVIKIYKKEFDYNKLNLDKYLSFLEKSNQKLDISNMEVLYDAKTNKNILPEVIDNRKKIVAQLKPISIINIRTYSKLSGETDTKALTLAGNDNVAVIPASTINGALRSFAYKEALKEHDEGLFRDESNNDYSTNYQINDLYIEGELQKRQRTSINRFTGGAKNNALFDSMVFIPKHLIDDSKAALELIITFDFYDFNDEKNQKVYGYLKKTVEALCSGMLALGGETSIGYGIFNGKIEKEEA